MVLGPKMPNILTEPIISKGAIKGLQESLDVPRPEPQGGYMDALKAIPDVARGLMNNPMETLGGFGAGALEGARQQTDPISIGSMLMGGGGGLMKGAGRAAKIAEESRALKGLGESVPKAAHMVEESLIPEAKAALNQNLQNERYALKGTRADLPTSPQGLQLEMQRLQAEGKAVPDWLAEEAQRAHMAGQSVRDMAGNARGMEWMDKEFEANRPIVEGMMNQFSRLK